MIDIHTHILPGIDDGAVDLEETLEMLNQCVAMKVTDIILTPHAHYGEYIGDDHKYRVEEAFSEVKHYVQLQEIPVDLYLGMEVFAAEGLEYALENRELLCLGDSNYMLIEFPFEASAEYIFKFLYLLEKYRLRPVIAHPERYTIVKEDPAIAYEWNRRGYLLQVNSGSILGDFGSRVQQVADILLENNLAQIVASDAHSVAKRGPNLFYAHQMITTEYSKGYADLLLRVNPKLLLKNEEVLIVNPRDPFR